MYFEAPNLQVRRSTKGKLPGLPFLDMKNAVLGRDYDLSVLFPGAKLAEQLHITHKGKSGPANILSFPLSDTSGEIVISLQQARREAKKFGRTYENYLGFLFIHGLVHLLGYDHSDEMDAIEAKFRKKFDLDVAISL